MYWARRSAAHGPPEATLPRGTRLEASYETCHQRQAPEASVAGVVHVCGHEEWHEAVCATAAAKEMKKK